MNGLEIAVVVVAATYVCLSFTLFFFPTLLHRKKRSLPLWRAIAHRGGAGEELENTMSAFRRAVDADCDMLELDVQLTRDGEVVVCHDNNLERLTGIDGSISSTNYEDLPCLKKHLNLTFYKGHSMTVEHNNNTIPRLRELFEAFPNCPMNIDLKNGSDELVEKVHGLVSEFQRESITVWGSEYNRVCKKLYARNHNVSLFFSFGRVMMVYLLLFVGLLPFWPLRESHFEFLWPSLIAERISDIPENIPCCVKCLVRCCDTFLLHRLVCFHLRRRGIKVFIFVLNEEEDFDAAMRLGVDGIMTDYPSRLKEYYHARKTSDSSQRLLTT